MSGIKVVVKNGNIEKAISIFKKKVKDNNVLYKYQEKQHYVKKSVKKRIKKYRSIRKYKNNNESN